MRRFSAIASLLVCPLMLTGCGAIGEKAASISVIYGVTALLALGLLIGYCVTVKKKDPWYLLLFASMFVVNTGYFALAISRSLGEALLANRLAYLGSVFLPLSMWMIILNVTNLPYRKWLPGLLVGLSVVVFLIAASPGYLDIYYKEVTFQKVDGVTILDKVYGPLHILYLLYLIGYFAAMVAAILFSTVKKTIGSPTYAMLLAMAVLVNIGVWLSEQLVSIDFEILSISYIISGAFLLGLHALMAEAEKSPAVSQPAEAHGEPVPQSPSIHAPATNTADTEQLKLFAAGLATLTPKERALSDCYISGMTSAQIMEQLSIKENTLKFHNKNLYSKLGVSSRKQLLQISRHLPE